MPVAIDLIPQKTSLNCPVIWLVGLSGSGKSTLASGLSNNLNEHGIANFILDGDDLRTGLTKDLGFTEVDRKENLRRAAELAKLFQKAGVLPICSFISPSQEMRRLIAEIIGEKYVEVYVECSLEMCEKRDVKGLYKKARIGEISNFTGVSAIFEIPLHPTLKINTENFDYSTSLTQLTQFVLSQLHSHEL